MRSYDGHFIIRSLNKVQPKKLNVVPLNMEKYTTFFVDELLYLDSNQFLSAPLAMLAENLPKSQYSTVNWYFKNKESVEPMTRKGFFPYEYLDDYSKFDNTSIPRKTDFYSQLNKESISDENCKHVLNVWNTFDC